MGWTAAHGACGAWLWLNMMTDRLIRIAKNSGDPACALPRMEDFLINMQEIKEAYASSKEVLFSARSGL